MQVSLEGLTLHVADIERSVEFYSRVPGAVVVAHYPGQFALLRIGRGRLGLLKHQGGFHIEIESSDLQETYEQLRSVGIEPKSPPTKRAWGETDFIVIDPDGNMVEFGEAHEHE